MDDVSVENVVDYFQKIIEVFRQNDEGSTAYDNAVEELADLGLQLSDMSHDLINLTTMYQRYIMTDDQHILSTLLVTWTDTQLLQAYRMIAAEHDTRKKLLLVKNKNKLYTGCKVSWTGRSDRACIGTVVKVKTKKAIVEEDTNDTRWDVPMSMLTILASQYTRTELNNPIRRYHGNQSTTSKSTCTSSII